MFRFLMVLWLVLCSSSFAVQLKAGYQSVGGNQAPAVIRFKVSADVPLDPQTRFSWDFGDGEQSNSPSPEHTYVRPGTYRASVTVQMPGLKPIKIDLNVRIEGGQEKAAFVLLFAADGSVEVVNTSTVFKSNPVASWTVDGKTSTGDRILLRDTSSSKKNLKLSIDGARTQLSVATEFRLGRFSSNKSFEDEVLAITNEYRAKGWNCDTQRYSGPALPLLKPNAVLALAATAQSVGMAANQYFAHQSPRDNSLPIDRAIAAGYDARSVGENIARGQKTPRLVVDAWARSHGHCVNIMGDFQELGVSYINTGDPAINHYWTQVFGKPL